MFRLPLQETEHDGWKLLLFLKHLMRYWHAIIVCTFANSSYEEYCGLGWRFPLRYVETVFLICPNTLVWKLLAQSCNQGFLWSGSFFHCNCLCMGFRLWGCLLFLLPSLGFPFSSLDFTVLPWFLVVALRTLSIVKDVAGLAIQAACHQSPKRTFSSTQASQKLQQLPLGHAE